MVTLSHINMYPWLDNPYSLIYPIYTLDIYTLDIYTLDIYTLDILHCAECNMTIFSQGGNVIALSAGEGNNTFRTAKNSHIALTSAISVLLYITQSLNGTFA